MAIEIMIIIFTASEIHHRRIIMSSNKTKDIVYTGLLAALVCVATFIIKVPLPVSNGYVHIGDGVIFIAVILLGKKNGALAGAIGAALADILGGYSFYVFPTFVIKGVMGLIMGTLIEKHPDFKYRWITGAALGSIWQVVGYYFVGSLMVGNFISTISEIPGNTVQSAVGILEAVIFMSVYSKTSTGRKLGE
jgi:uncharacterized membrane protein